MPENPVHVAQTASQTEAQTASQTGKRRRLLLVAATLVCAIAVAGILFANAQSRAHIVNADELGLIGDLGLIDELSLVRDPIDLGTMEWLNLLQSAFQGDPNFGAVAISPDVGADVVMITWYGEPSEKLQRYVSEAPNSVRVVVQVTPYRERVDV